MNQLKTLFKILDAILLEPLDTVKSYQYFLDCKDNHKSWQAFEVLLHGTVMELIRIYCAEEKSPTPLGFLQWQAKVENPTLSMICSLMLNLCLGVYIQRVGERNNDARCSDAGRMKVVDVFFGFNHPIYREVEYNEWRNRVIYPEEILRLRTENISFRGHNSPPLTNQGGDFKLEERVQSLKRMAPKGGSSNEMWQRLARSHDQVNHVVSRAMQNLGLNETPRLRLVGIKNEINLWRAVLRHSQYLKSESDRPVSFDGCYLDGCMDDIMSSLQEKTEGYFQHALTTPLQNIQYDNLRVLSVDINEEIHCYVGDSDDDSL